MRINIALYLAISIVISNAYAADQNKPDLVEEVLENCSYSSQAGMHDCLAKKVRESSRALVAAEKKLTLALQNWDEQRNFVARASEQYTRSNHAYLQYRDAQCAFAAALGGGAIGNALKLRSLACIFGLNTERANQLTRLASTLPAK